MTRIMLAAFLALSAAPAPAAERRYSVTDFDRIQVDGPFQVTLTTGRSGSALASGSNAAIERVSIDVQGRTLRIRPNRSGWGGYPGDGLGPVRILLSTHALRGAALAGSGRLSIDKARTMRFDASVSGSGRIDIGSIEADMLAVALLGSGKIAVGGKAKSLRATIQGTGDLEAEGLSVEDAQINADTSGLIAVGVRRAATVTSSGQGDTKIIGSPACTVKSSGSGQVLCGKSDQSER
jgi:hypothetical protein